MDNPTTTPRRRARVERGNVATVTRYIDNTGYVATQDGNGVLIEGRDVAGWTLDGYVIPRLASGLIFAREVAE